jgi:hypothetical protein
MLPAHGRRFGRQKSLGGSAGRRRPPPVSGHAEIVATKRPFTACGGDVRPALARLSVSKAPITRFVILTIQNLTLVLGPPTGEFHGGAASF